MVDSDFLEDFGRRFVRLSYLRGLKTGAIKNLSGFNKTQGHKIPEYNDEQAESFINQAGAHEVRACMDSLLQRIRHEFNYRRRELTLNYIEGSGSIQTPDFELRVWVDQDPDKPGNYRQWTEVAAIQSPSIFTDSRFLGVFENICNTLVIELLSPLIMEEVVDHIEDHKTLSSSLSYPSNLSWIKLVFRQPPLTMQITPKQIQFQLIPGDGLKYLVEGSFQALWDFDKAVESSSSSMEN